MNFNELETREVSVKKLYTGIAPIQIVMVNPTSKMLADFYNTDIEKIKEPVYIKESDDPSTRIDFYYTNHPDFKTEFKGKFSIFIKNGTRVSNSGKKQYIDAFTKTSWANSLSELSANQENAKDFLKLDMKTVREAHPGEEAIYTLLKAYGNLDPKTKPLELNSWNNLVKGDGSELQRFFEHFNVTNNGVNVLMGVKDFKYQDIYTGAYLSLYGKVSDYFKKGVESEYGFKSYFDSYSFSEYEMDAAPQSNEVDYTPNSDSPFISASDSKDEFFTNNDTTESLF